MASDDYGQASTVLLRLGEALSLLNPVKLVSVTRKAQRQLRTPPPGNPEELRALAEAFRWAAAAVRPVVSEVDALRPAELWSGIAASSATQVRAATAVAVRTTPRAFLAAATALDELADRIAEQRRRHDELRRALREAVRDATHIGSVPAPDPAALDDLMRAAAGLIRGCIEVYTDAMAAADEAAAVFADLAGRARAGAGVSGGLDPADAVVLAAQCVRIRGVGDDYDDGILTVAQLARLGRQLDAMPVLDRANVGTLVDKARSDTERAYLLKAVAAGHPAGELAAFATRIHGRDDGWLHDHLSLIDRGGSAEQDRFGFEVDQYDPYTCGTTSLIVARAEADPLYALGLTDGAPHGFDERLSAEQARVHDTTNLVYPEQWGTTPEGMADWMNQHSAVTGTSYAWHLVDDTGRRSVSRSLREVVTAVDAGHPVPILVGGVVPRHYVLAVGHSGDDLLIFEPTSGATVRVPAADFLDGKLRQRAGFDHVQAIVVPQAHAGGESGSMDHSPD